MSTETGAVWISAHSMDWSGISMIKPWLLHVVTSQNRSGSMERCPISNAGLGQRRPATIGPAGLLDHLKKQAAIGEKAMLRPKLPKKTQGFSLLVGG